jgi:hypothetical protein
MEVLLGKRDREDEDPSDDIDGEDVCIELVEPQATTIALKNPGKKRYSVANETVDQRAKRLATNKKSIQKRNATETLAHKTERRAHETARGRARKKKRHAVETIEERKARLVKEAEANNESRRKRRAAETTADRDKRFADENSRQNELRAARIEAETSEEETARKKRECESSKKTHAKKVLTFYTMFGDGLGM